MPGSILSADTGFPNLERGSTEEKLAAVSGYLYQLLEQLRYTLNNLGADNFNDRELELLSKTFTQPLFLAVKDIEGNIAKLQMDSESITTRVESVEEDVNSKYTEIKQTADSITSTVSSNKEELDKGLEKLNSSFSEVKQTVNGLTVTTETGTTYISGNGVHGGTIEGSELKSVLRYDAEDPEGKLSLYYSGPDGIGISNKEIEVGGVWLDKNGEGTGNSEKYRMYVGTIPGRVPDMPFPLKLQSGGNSSYSANGNIFLDVPVGKEIVLQIGSTQWRFSKNTFSVNGKTIATV